MTRYEQHPAVQFKKWSCFVEYAHYVDNQRPALLLRLMETGEPVVKATVNLPDESVAEKEVFIKDYSENEGILRALVGAGIIEDTGRTVPCGREVAHVAVLL